MLRAPLAAKKLPPHGDLKRRRRGGACGFVIEGLFQPTHLVVIPAIALFFFGPSELPEAGKGIGEGIRNFKSSLKAAEADSAAKPD